MPGIFLSTVLFSMKGPSIFAPLGGLHPLILAYNMFAVVVTGGGVCLSWSMDAELRCFLENSPVDMNSNVSYLY